MDKAVSGPGEKDQLGEENGQGGRMKLEVTNYKSKQSYYDGVVFLWGSVEPTEENVRENI